MSERPAPSEADIMPPTPKKERRRRAGLKPDSRTIGTGPLTINVTLARALGWEEDDIAEVAAHLNFVARDHNDRAAARYPQRYRHADGVMVFIGELPDGQK